MPTYEAVLVLIGSALARPVGVAVVDLGAGALAAGASFDPGGVGKLAAIVAGDGSEYLREQVAVLGLEPVNRSDDSAAVLDPADDLLRDVQPDDLELVGELFL